MLIVILRALLFARIYCLGYNEILTDINGPFRLFWSMYSSTTDDSLFTTALIRHNSTLRFKKMKITKNAGKSKCST